MDHVYKKSKRRRPGTCSVTLSLHVNVLCHQSRIQQLLLPAGHHCSHVPINLGREARANEAMQTVPTVSESKDTAQLSSRQVCSSGFVALIFFQSLLANRFVTLQAFCLMLSRPPTAGRPQPLPRHLDGLLAEGLQHPWPRRGRNVVRRGSSGGTGHQRCSMVSEGSAFKPLGHLQKAFLFGMSFLNP